MKIGWGVSELWRPEGRKSPSPIDLAHGLYNILYYRTSRDILFLRLLLTLNLISLLFQTHNYRKTPSQHNADGGNIKKHRHDAWTFSPKRIDLQGGPKSKPLSNYQKIVLNRIQVCQWE